MKTSDIKIIRQSNVEDFNNYGLYILLFKRKFYIGCAYDETIEMRRRAHIAKCIDGTTPKDKQLREEGGCTMEVLYTIPSSIRSKKKRKKLIKLIERYVIHKLGHFVVEELTNVDIVDETLSGYKEAISEYMLNSQY